MSRQEIDGPSTLRRVVDAMLLIEADLDLPVLLRHVIEEASAMTGARHGGLGVLDESRTRLAEFITVGKEVALAQSPGVDTKIQLDTAACTIAQMNRGRCGASAAGE